jgi:hypothetical protein
MDSFQPERMLSVKEFAPRSVGARTPYGEPLHVERLPGRKLPQKTLECN